MYVYESRLNFNYCIDIYLPNNIKICLYYEIEIEFLYSYKIDEDVLKWLVVTEFTKCI